VSDNGGGELIMLGSGFLCWLLGIWMSSRWPGQAERRAASAEGPRLPRHAIDLN
jgi:hypothetical protein